MLFSEKLKLIRKENNLTQESLAEKLNVSRQAITKWECNEGIPDIENLKQISKLFKVSIDELIMDDKNINIETKKYSYVEELEIDHIKKYDINTCEAYELNIKPNNLEKVVVEILMDEDIKDSLKIKFDDIYYKLDIDIKNKLKKKDIIINIYIPEKYIEEIELNSKLKYLNITNINFNKIEYDGKLKYLNVLSSKGRLVLNTTKCDVEAVYDKLDGTLEVNTFNSVSRLQIPSQSEYKVILKGRSNEFVNAHSNDDAKNIIELNGLNSKLIINENEIK